MNNLWLCTLGLLAGWSGGLAPQAAERQPPTVVTTFLPAYCFTVNVAGPFATVQNLLPDGVSPHDYQLSPSDLRKLSAADLVVVNGLGLDDWLGKTARGAGTTRNARLVELAEGLGPQLIREAGHSHGADEASAAGADVNPHFWLDPLLAAHAVTNVLRGFEAIDPAHAADYRRNAAAYVERLHALDAVLRTAIAGFTRREIVTHHNAFPYFARRYGLTVLGVVEEVPELAPSPRQLNRLHALIRRHNVPVVFTEPQSSPQLVRQIALDLGVPVEPLDTLETGPLTPSAYEDGLRRNLRVLEKYLR
jgi:zinc/manganese transport system substrate-binding protein